MDNRTLEEVRNNETKLIEEIKSLEKQLDYLRSGEYYNQLRFENEMLQQVIDTNGVPSEVYDYIDCTHRNTELLEENQSLKKQLESANEQISYLRRSIERKEERIIDLQDERIPYTNEYVYKLLNQQKEFIGYLEKIIEKLECDNVDDEEMKGYLIQRKDTFKEILSKYYEIIGGKDE